MLLDSPEKMDDSDVQPAWNWLGIEAGEMFVLSAVYETAAETPTLMAASLLAGPRAIATGWPSWRLAEAFRPPPSEDEVSIPGTFKIEQNGAIAGRAVMTPDEAYGWLRSVLERRSCPAIGDLPHACAALAPAQAPIMVCTQSESPAGSLGYRVRSTAFTFHALTRQPRSSLQRLGRSPRRSTSVLRSTCSACRGSEKRTAPLRQDCSLEGSSVERGWRVRS
jgi:hypothetical protein